MSVTTYTEHATPFVRISPDGTVEVETTVRAVERTKTRFLADGVPCKEPGCSFSISKPCAGCGRIACRTGHVV